MAKSSRAPWKRSNPRKARGKAPTHLSAAEKATAKARARRAGRPYPNLVDNMKVAAAKKSSKKSTTKRRSKATVKKSTAKKTEVRKARRG